MTAFDRIMLAPAERAKFLADIRADSQARVAENKAERREHLLMIAQLATVAADDPETEYEFAFAVSRFAGADTFEQWIDAVRPEEDSNAAEIAESHAIEARLLREKQL